jgi:hypothetical protein
MRRPFANYDNTTLTGRIATLLSTRLLEVTSLDLAIGKPRSASKCPVALAVQRTFPTALYLTVTRKGLINITFHDRSESWYGGADLAEFIERIDATEEWGEPTGEELPKPRSFTIRRGRRHYHGEELRAAYSDLEPLGDL